MDIVKKMDWIQKGILGRVFEIFSGQDLYGQLRIFSSPGAGWYKAEAQTLEQHWIFVKEQTKLSNFFNRRILIKEADGETIIAVFNYRVNLKFRRECELKFLNGRFFVVKIDYWTNNPFVTIVDADKNNLLMFNFKVIKWKLRQPNRGEIEISALAQSLPELPVLILFGQYLVGFMRTGPDTY